MTSREVTCDKHLLQHGPVHLEDARPAVGGVVHVVTVLKRRAEALEAVHHQVVLVAREAYQVPPVIREPVHVHILEPGHRLHLFPAETFSRG